MFRGHLNSSSRAASESAEHALLPDLLAPGLDVVFVGAAPSRAAAMQGHYYAGGRNRFWLLLHQAGFTPYPLEPEEDASALQYGIGLTALMLHVISIDNRRLPPPTEAERAALRDKLRRCAPRFVCYNGKDVHRMAEGVEDCPWGLQKARLGASQIFVLHSTSGRADRWGADRLHLFRELKRLIDAGRADRAETVRDGR